MRFFLVFLSSILLLVGCSSPNPTFYTLNAPPIAQTPPTAKQTRIMVGPVTLPAAVDRPQLVVQKANNTLQVFEYRRWANTLKGDVADVIVSNVAQALQISNVWSFSQSTQTNFDYQVFIDVQNLESKPGDRVVVDVLWTIKPSQQLGSPGKGATHSKSANAKPIMGRSLVQEPVTGDGFEALVLAQSKAFARVGQDIAKSMP